MQEENTMGDSKPYEKRRCASQRKLAIALLLSWSLFVSLSVCRGQGSVSEKKVEDAPAPCGPGALHVALSLLGASVDLDSCLQLTQVDPNGTTTLANIQAAASTLGYAASGMRLTPEELAGLTVPAILHVTLPSEAQHFLVYRPGDGSHIRLIDPSMTGLAEAFTPDQLGLMWEGDCLVFTSKAVAAKLKVALGRVSVVLRLCVGGIRGAGHKQFAQATSRWENNAIRRVDLAICSYLLCSGCSYWVCVYDRNYRVLG